MIRDLDGVSLAFSMWEQARRAVKAAEEKLIELRRRPHTPAELQAVEDEILRLRAEADRLLDEAIAALRRHNDSLKRPG